jgi:lipopolysaccharide transport system permease protein
MIADAWAIPQPGSRGYRPMLTCDRQCWIMAPVTTGENLLLAINTRQFWAVFFTKLGFNLRSEVSRTYLGYLWWLIEPIMFVIALYVVFGIFLRLRSEGFIMFLICGQVAYSWFARSVGNSSRSLLEGRNLINQVSIQKIFFPLVVVSQDFVKQSVVFVAMFAALIYFGASPALSWISFPALIVTQFLLILALGMACAAVVPLVPDLKFLISTLLMMGMWASGIFYSYTDVLIQKHQDLFLMNPMANLIKNYRQVLLDGQWPDWTALATISLASLVLIAVMMLVFRRFDTTYARLALQ